MRILIIGNDPHEIEGVANYTRPMAVELSKFGHQVFYFYSGAWKKNYNWLFMPYLRINRKDFPFECAEVVNSPNWTYNAGSPWVDISEPRTENIFLKYVDKIRPEIMHVHSRLALPTSIIELASKRGIKVFNTIHVYGFLCQKRVMIDDKGKVCGGPSDLEKCSECTGRVNTKKIKLMSRIEKINKDFPKWIIFMKSRFRKEKNKTIMVNNDRRIVSGLERNRIKTGLSQRLHYMVYLMNHCIDVNICVSEDVQRTLLRYGVNKEKLLVLHLGSKIAENQKRDFHGLHNPLVIGNIGGVGYYKGTHVLLEAIEKMKNRNFKLKIYGKYENAFVRLITEGKENLPAEFLGKYTLEDLPGILEKIDLMVLPSICKDTAPQTIFESFSARIPIVASNIGGFPDFIKDGVNGYLFEPGDSQDLAKKLDRIVGCPEMIINFAKNIPTLKTIRKNAEELMSIYEKSMSGSP